MCPNPQFPVDLVILTEEILHFLYSEMYLHIKNMLQDRNNRRKCSVRKSVLKKLRKFDMKAPVLESLFNKDFVY